MGRPRKQEQLLPLSSRITPLQHRWLAWEAERRFDGEVSRTLRWALDQGRAFSQIMMSDDPVEALDRALNPEKYPQSDYEEGPTDAERAAERLRRERAVARAFSLEEEP
jgi:hypothetical protein